MKKFLLALFLLPASVYAGLNMLAQADGRFSIGMELAAPTGDFAKQQNIGLGGTIRLEAPIGDYTAFMFTGGYLHFAPKAHAYNNLSLDTGQASFRIPIQLGMKVYFQQQQSGFYLMLNGGTHGYRGADEDSTGSHKVKFAISYAPEFGFHLENFDIGMRVQFINTPGKTTSYIGFRFAYVFGQGIPPMIFAD